MRRDPQPVVTLSQCRADPEERSALQHCQIAVDQPWRGRRCGGAEVALLNKDHPQTASRGVACDADPVQATANDRKIVVRRAQRLVSRFEVSSLERTSDSKGQANYDASVISVQKFCWRSLGAPASADEENFRTPR
jgi:hypothetical protein